MKLKLMGLLCWFTGILGAMKNKEKLQRSKSETNLKSPTNNNKTEKTLKGGEPRPAVPVLSKSYDLQSMLSGQDLRQMGTRPKSWSPDNLATREIKEGIKSSSGVSHDVLATPIEKLHMFVFFRIYEFGGSKPEKRIEGERARIESFPGPPRVNAL